MIPRDCHTRYSFTASAFLLAVGMISYILIGMSGCSSDDSPPPPAPVQEKPAESLSTKKPNTAPLLKPIGSQIAVVGKPLVFPVQALDTRDDVLYFNASLINEADVLPAGAALNKIIDPNKNVEAKSRVEFSWTPTEGQQGKYSIRFKVSDTGSTIMSDEEIVEITVYGTEALAGALQVTLLPNTARPANLTYNVRIQSASGDPVPGIKEFQVLEDGYIPPTAEGNLSIFPNKYDYHTLLMLDLSGNIENDLDKIIEAAKLFSDKLIAMKKSVAIYSFSSTVKERQGFTKDANAIYQALNAIKKEYTPGAPTNLYGSIIDGLKLLDEIVIESNIEGYREAGLVVFTDGYHTTGGGPEAAQAAVNASPHQVYTIGLNSGNLDRVNLDSAHLGKSGFFETSDTVSLKDAFANAANQIAARILYESGRYYLLAYCSPLRDTNEHVLQLSVTDAIGRTGSGMSAPYRTDKFTDGCTRDMEVIQLDHYDFDGDGYYDTQYDGKGLVDGRLYDCDDLDPYNWDQCGTCLDADGDGFGGSKCDLNVDCKDNPTDKYAPYINPDRTDTETDGFDQDCDGYDGPRG